jgi:HEAT repeat protein
MGYGRHSGSPFGPPRFSAPGVLLLALALGGATPAQGQNLPPDPVEELREVLAHDRDVAGSAALEFRRKSLSTLAEEVHTLRDLARALELREWDSQNLNPRAADVDREVRKCLEERFTRQARDVMAHGDPESARAAATLVAEMAAAVRAVGAAGDTEERLASFAPGLTKLTRAPDPSVRTAAVRALGRLGPRAPRAVAALETVLTDDDVLQRRAAAEALANLIRPAPAGERAGPAGKKGSPAHDPNLLDTSTAVIPVAGVALKDADAEVRRHGVEAVRQAAENLTDAIELPVGPGLPSPGRPLTQEERERITRYRQEVEAEVGLLTPLLDRLGDQGQSLARLVLDPEVGVRVVALRALEQIGYAREKLMRRQATMPPLLEGGRLPGPRGRPKPLREPPLATTPALLVPALSQAAPAPPRDPLVGALRQTLPALVGALSDPDVRARLAAVDALEMIADVALPAVPGLTRALSDPDLFVRWAAARTLGEMARSEEDVPEALVAAVPGIARLLCDLDLDVRLAAAASLGQFGPAARAAVSALAQTVNKGDVEIRVAALEALGAIGPDAAAAIPAVIEALSNNDPRVRSAAVRLLGRFGPAARQAADGLRSLLTDPDPEVRRLASEALLRVLKK